MNYSNLTIRSINSLTELEPGDHIQVPGERSPDISYALHCGSDNKRCDCQEDTHHLLVVKVVDQMHLRIIHKVSGAGVREEIKSYRSSDVKVLDYISECMRDRAIERARPRMEDEYNQLLKSCEDFIRGVRTDDYGTLGAVKIMKNLSTLVVEEAETIVGGLIGAGIVTLLFPGSGTLVGCYIGGLAGKTFQGRFRRAWFGYRDQ